jgi:hypothetical protein
MGMTKTGKAAIAGMIVADVATTPLFDAIAIGIDATAFASTQTKLLSEITTSGGERRTGANVTGSLVTTTDLNDTAQWVTTFTFTGGFAVNECMVGNNASADTGVMLCRSVFVSTLNVISGDTLTLTMKVKFA